jgi:hypothetical protein
MSIDFKSTKVFFDSTVGQKQTEPGHVTFTRNVRKANAALRGFKIEYTNEDREIFRQEVDIDNIQVNNATVNFDVDLLLRDSSGNIDDPFEGVVEVLVIADLA